MELQLFESFQLYSKMWKRTNKQVNYAWKDKNAKYGDHTDYDRVLPKDSIWNIKT